MDSPVVCVLLRDAEAELASLRCARVSVEGSGPLDFDGVCVL